MTAFWEVLYLTVLNVLLFNKTTFYYILRPHRADRVDSSFPNHPPSLSPTILSHLNPTRQRPIHRHANPHSCPGHSTQPERRQHQKHRSHHQIDNHVILRILDPGQIPVTVGIAVVEYIQQPAIEPPRQFPPEGEEEQRKLYKCQRHYHLLTTQPSSVRKYSR